MEEIMRRNLEKRNIGEKMERIPTHIQGFDELIEGGFTAGSINVLTGSAGSGKSIWTLNIAANFIRHNRMKVLYLSFEQPEWEIHEQGNQFGWNFHEMIEEGLLKFICLDSQEFFDFQKIEDIKRMIVEEGYQFVIFDSVTSVYDSPISSSQILNSADRGITPHTFMEVRRANVASFFNAIKTLGITVICIAQKIEGNPGDTTDNVSEFKGDSLTVLNYVEVGDDITRTVKVKKMRKTKNNGLTHSFEFTNDGIIVKPKEV